jgi:hypothetical protein
MTERVSNNSDGMEQLLPANRLVMFCFFFCEVASDGHTSQEPHVTTIRQSVVEECRRYGNLNKQNL